MTPARLQTIKEIFHGALDCEPDTVGAFLETACHGDKALRHEVEAFLTAYQQAGDFIDAPVASVAKNVIEKAQTSLLIGQTIGHYKISKRIDAGGMGEVYLASDITVGRKAALKLLPAHLVGDAERLKRFQQEARVVAGLNHPNILTVYEVGADNSARYIASELIEGETLRQRLARGPMQVGEAIEIAIQVTGALAAAHEAGVVHRDVKPGNIMLRPDGYVKVLDFGIAKLAESAVAEGADLGGPNDMPSKTGAAVTARGYSALRAGRTIPCETSAGSILGTVSYMSPEQARGTPVDKRTDIWSLGIVLYEMATGHAPFTGNTPKEVMAAILATEPAPLSSYVAHAPSELQQIVTKALRKNPDERFQSATEMLDALKGLRHKLEFAAELARSAPRHPWLRWMRSPVALALVLLVGVLVFVFYWFRNSTTSSSPEKSIAVLPFENLSGNPENAYFTEGIQEEILTRLAKIADLKVISRTSTQHFKSSPDNLPQIAQQLGVANILEGSVQRTADQVHVNVQLIKAATDSHLWAEAYDRKLTDIFAAEAEIATTIADTLQAKLTGSEKSAIAKRPTADPEAYELYLKGRFFWNKRTGADLRRAIDYFNQALAKDLKYALAYAGLADSYGLLDAYGAASPADSSPLAKAAAKRALELDDTLAEAHTSLAHVLYFYDFDFEQSIKEFERAIELNPNYANAHRWYGEPLAQMGRSGEAIAESKRARDLDPLSLVANVELGWVYMCARQHDKAIEQLRKTIEMDPRFYLAHWTLGMALQSKGYLAEAIAEYRKAVEFNDDPQALALLGQAYARAGELEEAQEILARLSEEAKSRYVPAYSLGVIYLALGDKERAIDEMERAYHERAGNDVGWIKVDPLLDDLRGNPRFEALVEKVLAPKNDKTDS